MIHGVTGVYKGLHGVTRVTVGYKSIPQLTEVTAG